MERKQLAIYAVTRTAIAKDGSERTSTTYHIIEEHAKIAEERDILKSKLNAVALKTPPRSHLTTPRTSE